MDASSSSKKFRRVLPWILTGILAAALCLVLFGYIHKGGGKKASTQNMVAGYIISFKTYGHSDAQTTLFNITGGSAQHLGSSGKIMEDGANHMTHMYVVPAGNYDSKELTAKLNASQGLHNLVLFELSLPITRKELRKVREVYGTLNEDASQISDADLSMFLNSKLKGEYTHVAMSSRKQNEKGQFYLQIIRVEDVRGYAEAMKTSSKANKKDSSNDSSDTIVVEDVVLEEVEEDLHEPPYFTKLPANIRQMTDAQIKAYIKKNDPRKIKSGQISIRRTAEEIAVTIKFERYTETIPYKLSKQ